MNTEYFKGKKVYRNGDYKCITWNKRPNVLVHRLIWEDANGPIPEGMLIHHKDFDKLNNDIDNLQMMTKSEHRSLHMKIDNPLSRYLYSVFTDKNETVGFREPLHYYMDKFDWNVNSLVYNDNCINGMVTLKNGDRRGWKVMVHDLKA